MKLLREPSEAPDPVGPLVGAAAACGTPLSALQTCCDDSSVGDPDVALRSAFRDFTDVVLKPYDGDGLLRLLTGQVTSVLDVDGAGVSLATGDSASLQFGTATDDDIAVVEHQQVSAGEGPCHEAYVTGEPVTVDDLGCDDRWPTYREVGLAHGVGAVAGIPMPVTEHRIGALNLYRDRPHVWGSQELETAQLLADMAGGYMIHANRADEEKARSEVNLKRALESRVVIGQATGILMAQHRISAESSFDLLRCTSQARNVKLRAIAAQIVESGALPTESG
jgi:GAF domain-containing protein